MKIVLLALVCACVAWGQQAIHGSRIFDNYTGVSVTNDGSTGTTLNKLAKYGSTANTAVLSTTSDTKGNIGIVVANAGTTGSAWVATGGTNVPCVFDGGVTAAHYVIASVTTGGDCHDTASAAYPTSGAEVLGKVVSATNGSAGTYNIDMSERQASTSGGGGGATIASVTNLIAGDGAGNGSDSSIAPSAVVKNNAANTYTSGATVDARSAAHTLPFKADVFANIPATCTVGERFYATDKTPPGYDCTATNTWTLAGGATGNLRAIQAFFTNGGSALSGTTTYCGLVPYSGVIQGAYVESDVSGSATFAVHSIAKASFTGNASATTDIVNGGTAPSLSSSASYSDTTLTSWSKAVAANTEVCVTLSSPATITYAKLTLAMGVN